MMTEGPFGLFQYITYNQTDIDKFGALYNYGAYGPGYTKNNVTANAHPDSCNWPVTMDALYQATGKYRHVTAKAHCRQLQLARDQQSTRLQAKT